MRTHTAARVASALVGLEGIALLALAGWQIVALAGGDTESAVSAIALIVLTLVAAIAVVAFAVGVWRGFSWARSGGIVTQVMILAVALGAATGAYAEPLTALLIALPALVTFIALLLTAREAGAQARREASAGDTPEG
ncbi:histidine kinase [Microbacterium sp. RU33B]|uniref:histidine kinase n=1 Tax=Microbacterium sp. RU33B TaxID=1907390 RepID=UPI00095AB33E|nr:histidine kinase [Microbacterium sp. RU33B]SIT89123.1 hypothetical protein SAMN05880545_3128 [Microbacterium sp. RU33B]